MALVFFAQFLLIVMAKPVYVVNRQLAALSAPSDQLDAPCDPSSSPKSRESGSAIRFR